VQKLIKKISCICHLADLTLKAGLKTLPIDVMFSTTFTTVVKGVSFLWTIILATGNDLTTLNFDNEEMKAWE
jgi:hypothetical protein